MSIKSYLTDTARVSDAEYKSDLTETANWRKRTEGGYASCIISLNGQHRRRFIAEKTTGQRNKWRVADSITGETGNCWSFSECRAWAQKRAQKYSRYKAEAYHPGIMAYTIDGKKVRIDSINAGGCLCTDADKSEGAQKMFPDVTCLYISCRDAADGLCNWIRKESFTEDVFNQVAEEEVREGYKQLAELLIRKKLTISTMESVTGGQIASLITDTAGASKILKGAYVTYDDKAKIMDEKEIKVINYNIYSKKTASAMAEACRKLYDADIGIGITGSPENTDPEYSNKEHRQNVYLAVSCKGKAPATSHMVMLDRKERHMYKLAIADKALSLLMDVLTKDGKGTKIVHVTAYPYATQSADIEIPAGMSPEEEHSYIEENFKNIQFGSPSLDYDGIDYEYYEIEW